MIKTQRARKIINMMTTAILVLFFAGRLPFLDLNRQKIGPVLVLMTALDLLFTLAFFRCPHCNSLLSFKHLTHHSCDKCGYSLD